MNSHVCSLKAGKKLIRAFGLTSFLSFSAKDHETNKETVFAVMSELLKR